MTPDADAVRPGLGAAEWLGPLEVVEGIRADAPPPPAPDQAVAILYKGGGEALGGSSAALYNVGLMLARGHVVEL